MSYADQLKKAQEKGTLHQLSQNIKQWNQAGDFLLGALIEISEFEDSEYDQPCNKYLFETDDGMVSTVLGAITDKLINDDFLNKVLFVMFEGKKESRSGRQYNKFLISEVGK